MNKKYFVFIVLAINIVLAILTQSFTENIQVLNHMNPYIVMIIFMISITLGSIVDILILTLLLRIGSVLMKNQISKNVSFKYSSIIYIGNALFSILYLIWLLFKDKANFKLDDTHLPVYYNLGLYISLIIVLTLLVKKQKKPFLFSILLILILFIYKTLVSLFQ